MRVGEISRRLGVHVNTVINLERRGIIRPMRDRNNQRRYTEEDLEKVRAYFFERRDTGKKR